MTEETCTEERFLKDIATHQMEIIKDEPDAYRHLRFKQPGTSNMYFDLVTWPGMLCYCGDMGTFVFSRLRDMFEFFRTDREYAKKRGRQLTINPSYWAEKLQAVDGNRLESGCQEFDYEAFKRVINEFRIRWMRDLWDDYRDNPMAGKSIRRELWEEVESYVLDGDEDETRAMDRAYSFKHRIAGRDYEFEDFWDHNFKRYTFRFLWCCYALAWGIEQYDQHKAKQPA